MFSKLFLSLPIAFAFNYNESGRDWSDTLCREGKSQSPIDLSTTSAIASEKLGVKVSEYINFTEGQTLIKKSATL